MDQDDLNRMTSMFRTPDGPVRLVHWAHRPVERFRTEPKRLGRPATTFPDVQTRRHSLEHGYVENGPERKHHEILYTNRG